MAVGIPARLRPASAGALATIPGAVDLYINRAERYRKGLRLIEP